MHRKTVFAFVLASMLVVFFFAGLKVVDIFIIKTTPPQAVAVVDLDQPQLTMNTLDVYPYDGAHTQSDFIIEKAGGALWSGDHGFFIDFDLDNPPAKEPNEIRLINIGGSGAAGWGAQNNYNMVYHRLERKFNETDPCGPGPWLRVINLAMGGTHSYQNYIALNRWAHPLEPDMILAYPGNNDLYVTLTGHADFYYGFPTVTGFVEVSRFSGSPAWQKWLAEYYPGLMRKTSLGLALRSLTFNRYVGAGAAKYHARYPDLAGLGAGGDTSSEKELKVYLDNITKPMFIHAFQSIKRDFEGIPIMIAWQAYMFPLSQPVDPSMDVVIPVPIYHALYRDLRRSAEQALRGYINDQWFFLDTHEYYHAHLAQKFPPGDGVHLLDDKAGAIADVIAADLFPQLCRIYKRTKARPQPHAEIPSLYGQLKRPVLPPRALHAEAGGTSLQLDGKTLKLASGDAGAVESVTHVKSGTQFSGWAIDAVSTVPAREVIMVANGSIIGRAKPETERDDIGGMNPAFRRSGWTLVVPPNGSLRGKVNVFAVLANGTVRELNYAEPFPFGRTKGLPAAK